MTRTPIEAARLLYVKGEHDLAAVEMLLPNGPLDVVCFHLHQACEKYLKAYLQANGDDFPRTHDLDALLDLCAERSRSLETFRNRLEAFLPYPVQLRYEWDYEPTLDEALAGLEVVKAVRHALLRQLPELG